MQTFRVLLFAGMREAVGAESISFDAHDVATAGDLLRHIRLLHPELEPWLKISRIAVNQSFVPLERGVDPTCEIALIPPVSGG